MNTTNTHDMAAGHELDALVAEKVMGIHIIPVDEMKAEARQVWETQPSCRFFGMGFYAAPGPDGEPMCKQEFRPYSTDIAAAWAVAERAKTLLPGAFTVSWSPTKMTLPWMAGWWDGECSMLVLGADTAPLAICRAALKAMGGVGMPR